MSCNLHRVQCKRKASDIYNWHAVSKRLCAIKNECLDQAACKVKVRWWREKSCNWWWPTRTTSTIRFEFAKGWWYMVWVNWLHFMFSSSYKLFLSQKGQVIRHHKPTTAWNWVCRTLSWVQFVFPWAVLSTLLSTHLKLLVLWILNHSEIPNQQRFFTGELTVRWNFGSTRNSGEIWSVQFFTFPRLPPKFRQGVLDRILRRNMRQNKPVLCASSPNTPRPFVFENFPPS